MTLDLSLVNHRTAAARFDYDWKTVVLYALGIGATREELDYVYEGRGPHVYPTFGVIPVFTPVWELLKQAQADLTQLVHEGQSLTVHRVIPPEGTLHTTAWIDGMYDFRRFAQISVRTETTANGELCFETSWSLVTRGQGGFGGPRPPKTRWPAPEGDRSPSWQVEASTRPEQALLYRLSGDINPLHADPEFAARAGFPEGPILHGLCTFGYIGRAVAAKACGGKVQRLRALHAQFRKPVWPGDAIRTEGYELGDGTVAVRVYAGGRPDAVINNCWAQIGT